MKPWTQLKVALAIIFFFGSVIWFIGDRSEKDRASWGKFKKEHKCKVVDHRTAVSIPGNLRREETCYLCDNGMKYWRSGNEH